MLKSLLISNYATDSDVVIAEISKKNSGNIRKIRPDMKIESYPAVIEGLNGVYFAGQRMMPPSGILPAMMSGRIAVQHLCRDTDTLFVSE